MLAWVLGVPGPAASHLKEPPCWPSYPPFPCRRNNISKQEHTREHQQALHCPLYGAGHCILRWCSSFLHLTLRPQCPSSCCRWLAETNPDPQPGAAWPLLISSPRPQLPERQSLEKEHTAPSPAIGNSLPTW